MNGLHIVHVLASFEVGGAERVALSLVKSQKDQGATVTVAALSDRNPILREQFDALGIETTIFQRKMRGVDIFMIRDLSRFFLEHKANLVHTHNPLANIYSTLATRGSKLPVVYTKHGDAIARGFRMWLRRRCTRMNRRIVTVSEATADTAMQLGEHNGTRPTVIENGVDCEVFQPRETTRHQMRQQLGFSNDEIVFGSVARLQPVKRHDIQLKAIEPILNQNVRIAVCGDGDLSQELNTWVANSAKKEFISMLGNRTDIPELLNAYDIFVLSSEREGLPLVVLEAMAAGTPVIATAVGGIPRVIEHGVNGFLVQDVTPEAFRSELKHVLELPPEELAKIGKAAREHVLAKYSTAAMSRAYEEVYRSML